MQIRLLEKRKLRVQGERLELEGQEKLSIEVMEEKKEEKEEEQRRSLEELLVRVVAAFPWQAEDFLSPRGTYRIRLTLEDPTARIHAFVYAEDGEKFFEGYPTTDVMGRKINKLIGITEGDDGKEIVDAPRNPPWIQCCIKSYYQDKTDCWGSRNYRIFGTTLLDA
ncbi:hypothetical protein RJ641_009628 [Dillenia turbinata]|uniref:POT1A/B-like OB fold domain-containing protein n=1 Tax=Dillenia turbinata TaxID=194707 RepID=A0AAN8VD95_9MAGN